MAKPQRLKAQGFTIPLIDVFPFPVFMSRAPTDTDIDFEVGQVWVYNSGATTRQVYIYGGQDSSQDAIWVVTGPGESEVDTLGCDAGDDPVAPNGSGNIDLLGTSGQIITTGDDGASSITWSLADELSVVTSVDVPLIIGGDSGSLNIKLGDNAGSDAVNILDSDDATVASINSDGDFSITDLTVVNLTVTGTAVDIGNSNSPTTILLGKGTGGNTININDGINTGENVVEISCGNAAANSTVAILNGNASAGTQTLNILGGTRAGAFNLCTGAAANVLTIGNAACGAITVDTGAGISLDAATASNFTVTGAADLAIGSTLGGVDISSGEAASSTSITLDASAADGGITVSAGTGGILIGNQADCTTIDVGDIAPTAARTITIGGGTVVTAAVTDTIDIGPDGATTNADSVKTVNINNGGVATGQLLTNIASGAITSGTHTTDLVAGAITAGTVTLNMLSGNVAAGTVVTNLLTGTGTKTLNIGNSTGTTMNLDGPFLLNDSINSNTSINTGTSTGTVSIGNSAASAITVDTAAGISLDAATASNFTVTGATEDLTLSSVGGSVKISSTEDDAGAIALSTNGGTTETINLSVAQGTGADSINLESTAGGITLTAGLASADAINLAAAGGGVDIDGALEINIASSQAAATAINIVASDGSGGITLDSNAGVTVGGNLILSDVATQLQMNGGAVTDFIGTATLNNGTITVANTNIAATDRIFIQRQDINGSSALGDLTYVISAATSFTITSRNRTTPANTETNDDSVLMYWIVRQN